LKTAQNLTSLAALAVALGVCAPGVVAQDPPAQPKRLVLLRIGDQAPPLEIAKWVKGAPAEHFERGKVYVVEFWATWCLPCIQGMPHLSALQREYGDKGLTVVSISCADNRGNTLEGVEQMIAQKGELVNYTIAWDSERYTHDAWMKAAGLNTIPHAFVVDQDGKLAFIDNPMFLDEPLEQILAGTWDIEKGTAALVQTHAELSAATLRARANDADGLAAYAEFEAKHPKLARQIDPTRFEIALRVGETDTVQAIAARWMESSIANKNHEELVQLARKIVDPKATVVSRDLELALRAANKASEITAGKNASVLDVLARIYAWKGDFAKAVELETQALALETSYLKGVFQTSLAEYKAKLAPAK
jgi:thiol-disulfide isomerase/thioredoxin